MVYIRWFILGVNKINFLPSYKNMENYISRKPMNLEGFDEEDKLTQYLENQGAIVLQEETGGLSTVAAGHLSAATELEQFSEDIIIPPLNTDIRFSEHLPFHDHTKYEKKEHSHAHTDPKIESFNDVNQEGKYLIIPPLNTDIRFSKELPTLDLGSYDPRQHKHSGKEHPHKLHTHEHVHENFSWAIPTNHDSPLDLVKKSLIHEVSTQHACGSCSPWRSEDINSDCLVVIRSAVGWSPILSAYDLPHVHPHGASTWFRHVVIELGG